LEVRFVILNLLYLVLRRVVWLIVSSPSDQMNTEVELLVVRHQLMVLKRQVRRPRLRRRDRVFMAAVSRVVPRARSSSFLVSPHTLLRCTGSCEAEVDLPAKIDGR
jgi:putative transposase